MESTDALTARDDHVKQLIRDLIRDKGAPIRFTDDPHWELSGATDEKGVSLYGWEDTDASAHILNTDCTWHLPDTAKLVERTYTQFGDTMNGNDDEVGFNVSPAHCTCQKYQNMHLRYSRPFGETLADLLRLDNGITI